MKTNKKFVIETSFPRGHLVLGKLSQGVTHNSVINAKPVALKEMVHYPGATSFTTCGTWNDPDGSDHS